MIPKSLISIFNEQELELIISGLPQIDVEELRANTEYTKYQSNSPQVRFTNTINNYIYFQLLIIIQLWIKLSPILKH